jgi:hypothetical protein
MYRDPVESLSAECARLRAELERAQADADVARRMTAPQRTLWTVAAVGAIGVTMAVCVMFLRADDRAHAELRECRADVASLRRAVDEDRREYMDLQERFARTRDTLEACQDNLADALKCERDRACFHLGDCHPHDPLCESLPVNRRAMR